MLNLINDIATWNRIIAHHYDPDGLRNGFNLTEKEIVNLAGGIPTKDFSRYEITISYRKQQVIRISVSTDFGVFECTLDFRYLIIENDLADIVPERQGEHIGTAMALNQLIAARQRYFVQMRLTAEGGIDRDRTEDLSEWKGYYFWGKFGYQMKSIYAAEFQRWLKLHAPTCIGQKLGEFLLLKANRKIWLDKGFPWDGYFDLADGSISMKYLQDSLRNVGINITL